MQREKELEQEKEIIMGKLNKLKVCPILVVLRGRSQLEDSPFFFSRRRSMSK